MFGPMTRLLLGRTMWLLFGLLLLIEAIFIAESFTTLMAIVVSNGGRVWDILLLLALKSPEIVDFALPLAILIGLYFALTGARDDSELVVYAAAGVSWWRIPQFAIGVGSVGMVVSVTFAGFITPSANYAQRLAIHVLETKRVVQEITAPAPQNARREIKDRTIIATPPRDGSSLRGNLFIFETSEENGWRVSQAKDWDVDGPAGDGSYSVRLNSFRDYVGHAGDRGADAGNDPLAVQLGTTRMQVSNLKLDFRLEELVRAIDRNRRDHEKVLLNIFDLPSEALKSVDPRFGEILGRALICLLAAGVAVAMATWSGSRLGRYLALPAGVFVVMGGDVVIRTYLGEVASKGDSEFWGSAAICLLALTVIPLIYPSLRKNMLTAPSRGPA